MTNGQLKIPGMYACYGYNSILLLNTLKLLFLWINYHNCHSNPSYVYQKDMQPRSKFNYYSNFNNVFVDDIKYYTIHSITIYFSPSLTQTSVKFNWSVFTLKSAETIYGYHHQNKDWTIHWFMHTHKTVPSNKNFSETLQNPIKCDKTHILLTPFQYVVCHN